MMGLASAARRLAVAVRFHQSRLLVAGKDYKTRSTKWALLHARHLTTDPRGASLDTRVEEAAYACLSKQLGSQAQFNSMDIEARETKTQSTLQFLERRLKMDRLTAMETVAIHPLVMVYSHDALERKLEWLTQQGIDDDGLRKIVQRHPQTLSRSDETLEATKQWFLDHAIAPSKIPYIFRMAPEVTGLSHATLNLVVDFLRDVGLDKVQIRGVLRRSPKLLTIEIDHLTTKVGVATRLGLTRPEVIKLVTNAPEYFWFSMDDIKRKLEAIGDLFGEDKMVRLWIAEPRVIVRDPVELRRTFEYLTKVVGMTPARISQNVGIIMYHVDHFVRPRFEFLTKIQSPDVDTVGWISMSPIKFAARHPGYDDFLASEFKL